MKKIFFLIAFALVNQLLYAQYNETIRTGRPGQAIGPFSVGKNVFQTQTGFDYGGSSQSYSDYSNYYLNPNTVLRYGISEKIEINSSASYRTENIKLNGSQYKLSGINTYSVGSRVNLFNNENNGPSIGLQGTLLFPITFGDYEDNFISYTLMAIVAQRISEKFSSTLNLGSNINSKIGIYVLNLGYSINEKFGVFAEMYGDFDKNNFQKNWDTGISFLANNNLQFDIYGGYGSNNNTKDYFGSIGISWRIDTKSN